jgi:hypothetical protein
LCKFSNTDFEFFVSLWGNGGPNWVSEEKKYYREQDQEWILVQKKNVSRASVFQRLEFPSSAPPGRQGSTVSRGNDIVNVFDANGVIEHDSREFITPLNNLYGSINGHGNSSFLVRKEASLPGLLPFFRSRHSRISDGLMILS